MLLKDKTLLITGASDGIGKAIAINAAREGATVILHGKSQAKLEVLYDDIVNASCPEPVIYPLDLEKATPLDFTIMQEAIGKEFNQLDGLINNAGWFGASTPVEQFDIELWHRVLQVNLNATFMLTQVCIPLLSKADEASIIFTADSKSSAYWGAYGVAKAGLQAFMKILADEMENTNIRVNAINPGTVNTFFRRRAYPGENPHQNKLPESVAPYYIQLLRHELKADNGQTLQLDEIMNR